MKKILILCCLFTLAGAALCPAACQAAQPELTDLLDFELGQFAGLPTGWDGGPSETLHADSLVTHGGQWACRLERTVDSPSRFTALTQVLDQEKEGQTITLRGFLRTENVKGMAGLWMRLDGPEGMVGFDNMANRKLEGTHDWAEYSIVLPYSAKARKVVFGALLSGEGKVWVDDLQLLVDGKPFDQAADRPRELTVLDTDTEFVNGSGFAETAVTPTQAANLALLGRVWGFLKYHHPTVTSGARHWDFDLFRVLPKVAAAADRKEAVGIMLSWIEDLGEITPCETCAPAPQDPVLTAPLAWLDDEDLLGRALGRKLRAVHTNRPGGGDQFYVTQVTNVGNPVFRNEPGYGQVAMSDPGYRLLALFRYWNIIEYWYPNRDIIGRDWVGVLTEYLPRVLAADTGDNYQLTMLQLIAEMRDGHANLYAADPLRPPVGTAGLPVSVRFVEQKALVTAYTDSTAGPACGLRTGDVIQRIDGEKVAELIHRWEPYYPASNPVHRRRGMARNLLRGAEGPVNLTVDRDGKSQDLRLERVPDGHGSWRPMTHDLPGETCRLLGEDVAYLKLSSVEIGRVNEYLETMAGTRGLIVDIRNYPQAFMVFALGSHFVTEPTAFARFTRGDLVNPGAFTWTPAIKLTASAPHYPGKVVILVDESSMSQAEYTAMAFRSAPNAVVVGSTTAGADGNISPIVLPGNLHTNISGIGVFYPDRSPTQRVGIVPDVEARPTVAGIRAGRDEVLEEAMRQILGDGVSDEEIQARYR